jgi:anti-sigma regulatory factor (Ser/Thr protein kinase)
VEAVLIDLVETWLHGLESLRVVDSASVSEARQWVRRRGEALGLPDLCVANLVIVVSELANNQVLHARHGEIAVEGIERDGVLGLQIIAADQGDGVSDPSAALRCEVSNPAGLGAGLRAVVNLSDEVDFDVRWGEGTCIVARKFASPVRRRREVGIVGRHHPRERLSGDHAVIRRHGDELFLALADGLGHGPLARQAAMAATRTALEEGSRSLSEVLQSCHEQLSDERGAVLVLARIDETRGRAQLAGVGNAMVRVCTPHSERRYTGLSATLGAGNSSAGNKLGRIREETQELQRWDALVLHSDGLSSRASFAPEAAAVDQHPVVAAQRLMERFAVPNDDALVLVAH